MNSPLHIRAMVAMAVRFGVVLLRGRPPNVLAREHDRVGPAAATPMTRRRPEEAAVQLASVWPACPGPGRTTLPRGAGKLQLAKVLLAGRSFQSGRENRFAGSHTCGKG